MKTLHIRWQRLTDADGKTCPRCTSTGDAVSVCVERLAQALRPMGIETKAEQRELSAADFKTDPLSSNRIWIGDKPIEEWLGARMGQSPCCDQCGDAECRTLEINGVRYEAIPENLILKAGLLAAAGLMDEPDRSP